MKLLNYTTTYFSALLLIIISVWAVIFYYGMLDEIYDSIDDGLDNQKQLIIRKAATDSSVLSKKVFAEGNYIISETTRPTAKNYKDVYLDTTLYMQNEEDFEPVRMLKTVFLLNEHYYELSVATSMVEEDDLITELLYTLVWLYVGLVASILLMNNFLLKKIWKPFYKLLHRLKSFNLDNPQPIQGLKTNINEFILLHETVQKMIDVNVGIYNNQKQFIENASHELQTPLAISINKLEALSESNNLSEEDFRLLAAAIDSLERLTRLNKSLLLLSKISKRQFHEIADVNINELVQKIVDDFSDQVEFSKINVQISNQENCTLQINPGLASIFVTNLIKNAVVHNIPGGSVHILITSQILRIENTGKNNPLNEAQIFSRFYKESRSSTSTGLGLAIVKAITNLYHFTASYSYHQKHILTITFRQ